MSRFLVTGGAGFIGSHLVDALVGAGHRVRVLDDLSTGSRANLPAEAELVVGDVSDAAVVRRAMGGMDGCFHLAAIASVARGNEDWLGTHRVNLGGTIAVLDTARALGGLPVVYASSAAVYGRQDARVDEAAVLAPLSAYGADKLGSELHAAAGGVVHGLASVGLRFFNVYGPRQDPTSPYSGVISLFAGALSAGRGLVLHGDGRQTRDFIFVADVVRLLVAAMGRAAREPGAVVLNACTGTETSVEALARTMAELLQVAPSITYGPARPGDIRRSVGDPARAARVLGLRAATALPAGLERTLAAVSAPRAMVRA